MTAMADNSFHASNPDEPQPVTVPPETARHRTAWKNPELPVLLFLVVFVALLALPHNPMLRDLDVGWSVKNGEQILATHSLSPGDSYSFTNHGRPYVMYRWGFELYQGILHRLAGLGGVVWGTALIVALTYSLLLYYLLRLGIHRLLALGLVVLALLVNLNSFLARAHTLTYLFYTVTLLFLEDYRRRPGRQLWALPPIFLLWANMHLGFVVGLGAVGLYGLSAWLAPSTFRGRGSPRDRAFLVIFPLCLAAVCFNPLGINLLVKIFQHSSEDVVIKAMTMEMGSPDFHQFVYLFLFLQMALLFWVGGRDFPGRPVLLSLVTVTLAAGLYSLRHVPFFGITATVYLAQGFRWPEKQPAPVPPGWHRQGWGWAALGAVLALVWVVGIEQKSPGFYQFEDSAVPRRLADYLASQAKGPQPLRIFSYNDQWADYFIYRLHPRAQVFIDTRFDFYGDAFTRKLGLLRDEALQHPEVLEPWQVDFLVLDKKLLLRGQWPQTPRWPLVYEDERSLVYGPLHPAASPPPNANP
jgi:hypothetical protein